MSVGDLDDKLQFDGGVLWQAGNRNCGAGVLAFFAEELNQQVAGAINHLRTLIKTCHCVDVSAHEEDLADLVQIADRELDGGEGVEQADLSGGVAILDGALPTDLSGVGHLAVLNGYDPGEKELVAGAAEGQVIATGRRRGGKCVTKAGEFRFDGAHAATQKSGSSRGQLRRWVFICDTGMEAAWMGNMNSIADWQRLAPVERLQRLQARSGAIGAGVRRAVLAATPDPDRLLAQLAAPGSGPLAGVPYFAKDLFDVAGYPTTASSRILAGLRPGPHADAAIISALGAAGAVMAGKTHLNEFAYGLSGENPHYGDCPHPFRHGALAGGSSSGSAFAVARGLVPFALGTDTGGSIRVPAAFCGLWGLRYQPAFLMDGCFPLSPGFDTIGYLCNSAADLRLIHNCLFGSSSCSAAEPAATTLRIMALFESEWVSESADAAYRGAIASYNRCDNRSAQLGFWMEKLLRAFSVLQSLEALQVHAAWLDAYRERYDPVVWQRIARARDWTAEQIDDARRVRAEFNGWMNEVFAAADVVVLPCIPSPSPQREDLNEDYRGQLLRLTAQASLAGLPTVVRPIGTRLDSLGLQYVCRDMDVLVTLLAELADAESSAG